MNPPNNKRRYGLPLAGAALGAALPAASTAEYLWRDYPKFKQLLQQVPIERELPELRSGDAFSYFTAPPGLTSMNESGANFGGSPAFHSATVMTAGDSPARLLEVGRGSDEGVIPNISRLSPYKSDLWYKALEQVQEQADAPTKVSPFYQRLHSAYNKIKGEIPSVLQNKAEFLRANGKDLPGTAVEAAPFANTSVQGSPVLISRPQTNLPPASVQKIVEDRGAESLLHPFSPTLAGLAGLKRLLAPSCLFNQTGSGPGAEYCTSSARDIAEKLNTPIAGQGAALPSDVLKSPHYKPVAVVDSGFDTDETRAKLLTWLEQAKHNRLLLGGLAAGGAGLLGLGAGYGINALWNRYHQNKKPGIKRAFELGFQKRAKELGYL